MCKTDSRNKAEKTFNIALFSAFVEESPTAKHSTSYIRGL